MSEHYSLSLRMSRFEGLTPQRRSPGALPAESGLAAAAEDVAVPVPTVQLTAAPVGAPSVGLTGLSAARR